METIFHIIKKYYFTRKMTLPVKYSFHKLYGQEISEVSDEKWDLFNEVFFFVKSLSEDLLKKILKLVD